MNDNHVERFEDAFGPLNFYFHTSNHTFIALNVMSLENSTNLNIQQNTINKLEEILYFSKEKTILLTHIPLHKPPGYCVDNPDISYSSDGTIIWQNMLSPALSDYLLNQVNPLFVFNGHDHEVKFKLLI